MCAGACRGWPRCVLVAPTVARLVYPFCFRVAHRFRMFVDGRRGATGVSRGVLRRLEAAVAPADCRGPGLVQVAGGIDDCAGVDPSSASAFFWTPLDAPGTPGQDVTVSPMRADLAYKSA